MERGETKGGRGMQPFSTLFMGLSFNKTLSEINKIHTFVNRELYKPFSKGLFTPVFESQHLASLR